MYTAGRDPTVRAWDPATGREVRAFRAGAESVSGLTVSADGSLVAGSGRNEIRVWDAKTGQEVFKLPGPGRLRFSADDQTLLSFGRGDYLRAFDVLTGKLKSERRLVRKQFAGLDEEARARLESFGIEPRAVELGPDGKTLVLSEGKDVTGYATDTGKERFALAADVPRVERVALSPDGRRLAAVGPVGEAETSEEYRVTVWNLADATRVSRFRVPMKTFWKELAFTADGNRVVTGSWEPVLRFWDAKTGEPAGTLDLPQRPECVALSPDGKRTWRSGSWTRRPWCTTWPQRQAGEEGVSRPATRAISAGTAPAFSPVHGAFRAAV